MRKRTPAEKAHDLAKIATAITSYTTQLQNDPSPPSQGLKPPVLQPPPAEKAPKASKARKPCAASKSCTGSKPRAASKPSKASKPRAARKPVDSSEEESDEDESDKNESNDDVSDDDESEDDASEDEDNLDEGSYIIEAILGERKKGRATQYQVKWKGFDDITWEPLKALKDNRIFQAYKAAQPAKAATKPAATKQHAAAASANTKTPCGEHSLTDYITLIARECTPPPRSRWRPWSNSKTKNPPRYASAR